MGALHLTTTAVEQALAYIELGWRPIPIPLARKVPIIDEWQKLVIGRDEVPRYFGERCNIGIVLGDVSGGLVDIDLDSPAAVSLAPLFLPETMAFGRASKPRSHMLYIARHASTEKFTGLDGSMIVELRANKVGKGDEGLQTVFPESVHPEGEIIEWDASYDQPTPRVMTPEELRRRVAHLAAAALLVSLGWAHDRAVAYAKAPSLDALAAAGVEDKGIQRIARWLGLVVAPPAPRNDRPLRAVSSLDRERIMKRARGYMERVPGAVSGSGGHQQTWDLAVNCILGFDLEVGEAREILYEYNRRCDPPWSEHELEHKLTDVMKADRVGRGWLLDDGKNSKGGGAHAGTAPVKSASPNDNAQDSPRSSGGDAQTSPSPPEDLFPTRIIFEVRDEGPPKWLVRDLWLEQAVGIIGGEPKSYKSFAAAQLATCVASGKPIFGDHEVQQGRVVMFNAEDRPTDTRYRIAQMCRALDVDLGTLDLHLIDVPALRLDDPAQVTRLMRTVARLQPALLILDPLRDLHGKDENDATIVSDLLNPLRIMQRNYGCAVMLVHHMAKLGEVQRRAGQRLRGSSALHGWVDSALYLTHKEGAIICAPEHRSAPSPDPFTFKLEQAESEHGPALWLAAQEQDDESKQERAEKNSATENAVIATVAGSTEPLTGRDIRKTVKGRAEYVVEAIRRLVKAGVLTEETTMRGTQPVPGYILTKRGAP